MSEPTKKKTGPPKGYKHTVDARLKMQGRKRSPETIARMSVAQSKRRAVEQQIAEMGVM